MPPTITAFQTAPDRGLGMVRDMPVRWALEELLQPYDVRLISFKELKSPEHFELSPFGKIPTYEEKDGSGLVLFESNAIILHIVEKFQHEGKGQGLLPKAQDARARAIAWMFAAQATVEPVIVERSMARMFEAEKPWFKERMVILEERVRGKLRELSEHLGEREWLEEEGFSVGDLCMIFILRRAGAELLGEWPRVAEYVKRGEAREGFQRAFEKQLAVWTASQESSK